MEMNLFGEPRGSVKSAMWLRSEEEGLPIISKTKKNPPTQTLVLDWVNYSVYRVGGDDFSIQLQKKEWRELTFPKPKTKELLFGFCRHQQTNTQTQKKMKKK